MSVADLYNETIKALPAAERLRLAKLILEDIPVQAVVDYQEAWTEEDLRDFSQASRARSDKSLEEPADA